jgi:hypothetical protein
LPRKSSRIWSKNPNCRHRHPIVHDAISAANHVRSRGYRVGGAYVDLVRNCDNVIDFDAQVNRLTFIQPEDRRLQRARCHKPVRHRVSPHGDLGRHPRRRLGLCRQSTGEFSILGSAAPLWRRSTTKLLIGDPPERRRRESTSVDRRFRCLLQSSSQLQASERS